MSFSDDTKTLEQSFSRTQELLQKLLQGLQARRSAWVSARPSTLAPSPELEQLTQEIAREEALRADLLGRIRTALPTPLGGDSAALHINVTRIAAALPLPAARSLRAVADIVQALAKKVRAEVTLGQRLVRFAQTAEDGVHRGKQVRSSAPGYDRAARMVRTSKFAGALVDGRV